MLFDLRLNREGQLRVEEIAQAVRAQLRDKTGEIYPEAELICAVESWIEHSIEELLTDAEEHLLQASAQFAFGRRHFQDELQGIQSQPIAAAVPDPAPALPIAV